MLVTACDDKYLSEARALIKSCAKHEPGQHFYLFLVNSHSIPDATIETWHPHIIIERVAWPYHATPRRGMMHCVRAIPIQKVLEEYREPTVYLDSDTLLRGRLTEVFDALKACDLMVQFRPTLEHIGVAGTPHASRFNSGVIALRPSIGGLSFAREYHRALREFIDSGKPIVIHREDYGVSVYADQELLYVTYLNMQADVVFKPLPAKFNDAKFDSVSIIWHGKGSAREHPQFIIEKFRYSNDFLFYPFGVLNLLLSLLRCVKHRLFNKPGTVS
jgi:hypothetical protein